MPRLRIAIQAVLLFVSPIPAASGQRIHLLPQFKPGDSLRYQIESRMTTAGTTTTPIVNPEGASQFKQSVSIILRLDVLEVHPGANGSLGSVRLRATYEKSSAVSESDAYDPGAAALADQYNRLEGRSMEFTVEPDGKLVDVKGLEDMLSNPSAAQTVRSWMAGLDSGAGFPPAGIAIGQKWGREEPLTGTPLNGLLWRTEATYLRNEICPANATSSPQDAAGKAPGANSEMCAIILTQFTIVRHGSRSEQTPEDYLRNGLRTSGTWTGSGESLDSISLATGHVVASAKSSSQDLDFAVTSTNTGSRMTYKGKIETQTQMNLLPASAPQQH